MTDSSILSEQATAVRLPGSNVAKAQLGGRYSHLSNNTPYLSKQHDYNTPYLSKQHDPISLSNMINGMMERMMELTPSPTSATYDPR